MFTPFAFRTKFIQNETPINVPGGNVGPETDPDAEAFLTAASITDPTISSAINQLVIDLKNAGLWDKSNAIYPLVGGTASTHKWNLKDPQDTNDAFRLSFIGGMTHSGNGITGNGTSNYATTWMSVNTELAGGGGSSQNDNHMLYYAYATSARNGVDMGAYHGASNTTWLFNSRNGSNEFRTTNMKAGTIGEVPGTHTNTSGLFAHTRTSSTQYRAFINKTKYTLTVNSATPPSRDTFIMAYNNSGTAAAFQNRTMSLISLGYGLTDAEVEDWVDINETFQTTLGRFV